MTITERDRTLIHHVARCTDEALDILEEELGEFLKYQRDICGSYLMGFWAALEQQNHPRRDGQSWKDLVYEVLGNGN